MDPARAPGQFSGRGHRFGRPSWFGAPFGVVGKWCCQDLVQGVFKLQVAACFTVGIPLHHNDTIAQGLNAVVGSVGSDPAFAVAKLLPITSKSNAIAALKIKINSNPIHGFDNFFSVLKVRAEGKAHYHRPPSKQGIQWCVSGDRLLCCKSLANE